MTCFGRVLSLWIGLVLASSVGAQDEQPPFKYPGIPKTVAKAEDFLSPGWVIVSKEQGDLNRDGRSDMVLVLWPKQMETARDYKVQRAGPFYRLVIAFAQPSGGYALVTDNTTLIMPPSYSGGYEDPLAHGDVRIVRGSLDISRQLLRGHFRYRFRWSKGAFRLIGYDYAGSNGHCITDTSINFLTRNAIIKTEALDETGEARSFVRRITKPPVTLEEASSEEYYPERDMTGPPSYCVYEGQER